MEPVLGVVGVLLASQGWLVLQLMRKNGRILDRVAALEVRVTTGSVEDNRALALATPVLLDEDRAVARLFASTSTPQAPTPNPSSTWCFRSTTSRATWNAACAGCTRTWRPRSRTGSGSPSPT